MVVSNPFFSKREPQVFNARTQSVLPQIHGGSAAPATVAGSTVSTAAATAASATAVPEKAVAAPSPAVEQAGVGSQLTVGPNIKLKGVEITDCDTLVVEGTVEATMNSRVMRIDPQGAFHGTAEVDIAEIHGDFTGALTVREKLTIHSTGKVSGKIRYGKIVMQEGSQLAGEIMAGMHPSRSESSRSESSRSAQAQAA